MLVTAWMCVEGVKTIVLRTSVETDTTKKNLACHIMALLSCRFWPELVDTHVVTGEALAYYYNGNAFADVERIIFDWTHKSRAKRMESQPQ